MENEDDSEGDITLLKAAKEEFENMQKAFQDMLEVQEKKMKETENKFLSLSKSSSGGKPMTQTGAGITVGPQNIIRSRQYFEENCFLGHWPSFSIDAPSSFLL